MKKQTILFVLILLFGLIFRLFLSSLAHHGDLNNNISWGKLVSERGLKNFYESKEWEYSAPNQPPLSIIMFSGLYKLWEPTPSFIWDLNIKLRVFPSKWIWFWDEKGLTILIKITAVLADLGIAYLLYSFLRKNGKEKQALLLASVWLLNPITWYNSSVWGQSDPIVNLFGLLALFFLLERKFVLSLPLLAISMLFKGSLAIFIPIYFVISIMQKFKLKEWSLAIIVSVFVVTISSIWFHPNANLFIWIFNLYQKKIFPGEIGDLTANAFNFWNILKGNKVLDSVEYFGVTARILGFIIFSVISLLNLVKFAKGKISLERVFNLFVIVGFASFLFMTRVHERYLYPIFPFLTLLLTYNKKYIFIYIITSIVFLLNMYNLWWYPNIPYLFNFMQMNNGIVTVVLSFVNILIFMYFFISFMFPNKNKTKVNKGK